ncbi:hypothetical protein GCM10007856_30190 [Azospirillum oryzae]|nr:hypothetical protein GCM10007856_30190 [Azospirillum oryzae]
MDAPQRKSGGKLSGLASAAWDTGWLKLSIAILPRGRSFFPACRSRTVFAMGQACGRRGRDAVAQIGTIARGDCAAPSERRSLFR